jgi:zona occludens toxin
LWFYAAGVVLSVVVGIWSISRFFHGHSVKATTHASQAATASGSSPTGSASALAPPAVVALPKASSVVSETWRVAGRFAANGVEYVVLVDGFGRMRVDSPGAYTGIGAAIAGRVDGERVAMWTGSAKSAGPSPLPGSLSR